MEITQFLFKMAEYSGYLILIVMGQVAHLLSERVKGESLAVIKLYVTTHFKSTVLSALGGMAGFATAVYFDQLNVVSAIGIGFMSDKFFNRYKQGDHIVSPSAPSAKT